MTRMTGGAALVEMLRRHGVDTLFALPGVQNDALFAALYDAGRAIRVIHPRHEQAAAYMAFGYARASGEVGAYAVVPGPGLLNTTAALSTAYATNAPVLCISGQILSHMIGRGYGMLHEIPDQLAVLRGLTKWAARVEHPTHVGSTVNEAFRELKTGRPRPVGLEVPLDVLALETELALPAPLAAEPPAAPDPALIDKAAALLGDARKPAIFVGAGAQHAGEALRAVAEMLEAPVVSHCAGRGILDDRHYLAQTAVAGYELWRDVDVVLAVGTRLLHPQTLWGLDERVKIIKVDIDPAEISRITRPAVGIVADANTALTALHAALVSTNRKRASRKDELVALKERARAEVARLTPQVEYLAALRAEIPEEGILVEELTQVGYVARAAYPTYRPRSLIHSGYQGTLGFGFPTALGAKVAKPDVPVVSISGDGGFFYNVQELSTAALHGIDIVAIVFTDGAFGNVRRIQKEMYGNRLIAVELRNPNMPKLAESHGIAGVRTEGPQGLRKELNAALKRRGPTLIEVPVGEMPDPWELFYRRTPARAKA
jgi:acetolactate synthase-1/2/3 large subunit